MAVRGARNGTLPCCPSITTATTNTNTTPCQQQPQTTTTIKKHRYRLWAKQQHTFGTYVANHSMVVLLGLSYCVVAPLIAPFCLLYFLLATLAQKYQLIVSDCAEICRSVDLGGCDVWCWS